MGQGQSSPAPASVLNAPPQAPHPIPANTDATSCPVSPESREAWLKAAQQHSQSQPQSPSPAPIAPHPLPPGADASSATECPVSPASREAWLKASQRQPTVGSTPPSNAPIRPRMTNSRLSTQREVSTIPRALSTPPANANSAEKAAAPPPAASQPRTPYTSTPVAHGSAVSSNSETAPALDIHTSETGHWVYPSEEMFYSAMKRKDYSPVASDMSSIIPIHNAVNERTWSEVLKWERGRGSEACGGPKLVSFEGDASKLTPRAWWKSSVMGYQRPFDRHDWIVDRCGRRVEYVIDFYQGREKGGAEARGLGPSFYLDVRPKLNSVEGVRMRIARYWGW